MASIRVNGASLPSFVSFNVKLVGKVVDINGPIITLEDAEGQQIQAQVADASQYQPGGFLEVTGKAINERQVQVNYINHLTPDFDLSLYNQMLGAYYKNSEIFYA